LEQLLRLTNRTLNVLQWEDWLVGVDHLAALVRIGIQRPGAIGTFRALFLLAMSDDEKIRRIEVFYSDQARAENFFSAAR
jgi:hypothetical protein